MVGVMAILQQWPFLTAVNCDMQRCAKCGKRFDNVGDKCPTCGWESRLGIHADAAEPDGTSVLRESMKQDPASLELANRYWRALAGPGGDIRSGRDVIDAYREPALRSTEGAVAFAHAYRELFDVSGELPRLAYFDESLIQVLGNCVSQLSKRDRAAIEWVLNAIRGMTPDSQ
jgi:predicted  nucleic acid-binding Zn-ribbon protein